MVALLIEHMFPPSGAVRRLSNRVQVARFAYDHDLLEGHDVR
jgi:hypothetical protein